MFRFKHYEKRPCSAYGEKVRNLVDDSSFNRLPACIAEHCLDGNQWSKEPPRVEGIYPVEEYGEMFWAQVWKHRGRMHAFFFGVEYCEPVDEMGECLWGPRMGPLDPPVQEESNEQ
jgi:hypothetical protein